MSDPIVPMSAAELRDAVRHGRAYDRARLSRVLRSDPERGLIEVQAGTPWRSVAEHLRPGDEQARNVGALLPSVEKSVTRNAAGPDGSPAVKHIESLTLVTPDGELRRVSRATNADLFALTVGGQGLFGALYSVTLRVDSLFRSLGGVLPVVVQGAQHRPVSPRIVQLLCPPGSVAALLDDCRALCEEWRIALPRIELRPTHAEQETYLAWARRDYLQVSLFLEPAATLASTVRLSQLCGALLDASLRREGSFLLAKTMDASREQVEACYPRLRNLLAEKRRIDPLERIDSPWFRHYSALLSRPQCRTRWNV